MYGGKWIYNPIETIAPRRGTALYAMFVLYPTRRHRETGELLSVSEAEGERLAALGISEPHPFRHFVPLSPLAGKALY